MEDKTDTMHSSVCCVADLRNTTTTSFGKATIMATKKTNERTNKRTSKKTASKAPKILAVTRKDGVSLMKTFGFTAPHKLTNEKLLMRLHKTGQYMEAFDGTLTSNDQKLVKTIIAAGDNISVDASDPAHAEPKDTTKKATKKTTKKTKAAAKPVAKKSAKRFDCICSTLKKLPVKGASIEQVAKLANSKYIKAGGKDNAKQTVWLLRACVLPALVHFDIVRVEKGRIFPSK